ncbi:bifunctional alpha,alpha-trehalose-phosphate synthase (UDP-forming)/trehalose-phosphatase [Flaviaesturariibacter amylovorans]|uniref:Bifunctional alpha,alpha-trehalose-phosphate synthase (UDP-forming)/trehalose-phosphatase n=2 Tax=Flaviaesturariibacter amylovorans TaxID=1084520 RepID=A0ABP8GVZ5_9BACT
MVVSNRLPYAVERNGADITVRQSSGGLVSAVKSYFEKPGAGGPQFEQKIWVGSVDTSREDWQEAVERGALPADTVIEPVFPDRETYDQYYNGFANGTIWPLFHYFPSITQFRKEHFTAYEKVNALFAERILELYQPGDVIWVHDYQLMLLPQMLREHLPDASIGFFLHIPFPSYELFRLLPTPWKGALLRGLLGADLLGFHTYDYVQHFLQSAKMILKVETQFNNIQYESRMIRTDLFPIGIDYQKFRDALLNDLAARISTSLEQKFMGQKIIFSVDRLDYTKGLSYRLEGFQAFLEKYPQWREKVVFIFNIVPSRAEIRSYADMRHRIEQQVSKINGKFSSLHWQPLIYRYNHLDFEELCALYQSADAALITPLRDGMNLVAKEYVASCLDKGVLILSELTGAASEMGEAVLVNPTDAEEVAEAIHTALTMPLTEQRNRLSLMQRRLAHYDVHHWINDFLESLGTLKTVQEKEQANILDGPTTTQVVEAFANAEKRCILLDYDGTLAPYQKLPSLAVPGKEVLQLLRDLAAQPHTEVVIISGRDAATLGDWLGELPVHMVAEHGAFIRYQGEEWQTQNTLAPEWKDQIRPLMELFVTRCVGSFIEEKASTLAWHYRNTHPDLGFTRSRELRNSLLQLTANTALQVIDGNKVLEVRQIGIDKGTSAQRVLDRFSPDFMLCIGDDTTDEDMFRVLRDRAVTIRVGHAKTAARYNLWAQTQVLPFLRRFLQARNSPVTDRS